MKRFPQILLGFFRARQLHQERARVESGPRRRRAARAVQTNRLLIRLHGVIVFPQGLVAEPEVVVSLHEIRVELDRLTRMDDGGVELLRVVVQARKPVGIERVARVRAGELVEFRARPVSMVKRDIGHGQSEPAALIERAQRVSFLHGDGRIEIFPVEKKHSAREHQQRSRFGIMVDLFHQNRFRAREVAGFEGLFQAGARFRAQRHVPKRGGRNCGGRNVEESQRLVLSGAPSGERGDGRKQYANRRFFFHCSVRPGSCLAGIACGAITLCRSSAAAFSEQSQCCAKRAWPFPLVSS